MRREKTHRVVRGVFGALALAACLLLSVVGVGSALAGFGFRPGPEGFNLAFTNRDGSPDLQAGSHPYEFTTTFMLNMKSVPGGVEPYEDLKDLRVELPAGLAGNPTVATKCLPSQLTEEASVGLGCPPSSQVGMIELHIEDVLQSLAAFIPVYNMATPADTPAVFGFQLLGTEAYISTSVRTGGDYGLTSSVTDASAELAVEGSKLILWGVPADPSHDAQRCGQPEFFTGLCESAPGTGQEGSAPHSANLPMRPLFSLPTACAGPLTASASVDSWQEPGSFLPDSFQIPAMEGCERVPFKPSVTVAPDSSVAGGPTGLAVDLKLPQDENPEGLAEADLRKAVVTLPAGMAVSPSAADGLGACTEEEIALHSPGGASCPDSSKVGSVEIVTPALEKPLEGSVYLAQQGSNPFGSLLALYLVAEGQGVTIKLAGEVQADPLTGRLVTTFDNTPQQPFSDLKLNFFGGPRAALVNPSACGTYTANAQLTPWSSSTPVEIASSFEITQGCHGAQFAPSFFAGTVNNQAGAFSPLSTTFSRSDQDETLGAVTVKTPPGLLGMLKSVPLCGEPQAAAGACGEESLIGHTTVGAGAGSDPVYVGGRVYLTGPYKGAPFGLSIVVPAVAGPFNLGNVVVRAAISVDPHTAQITVTSDPLPSILQGIPLRIKTVNVSIDRAGFMFNPTNCEALSVGGTITSSQGVGANVASHFQAANCAALAFKPSFTVSTQASTSKKNGASLDVKLGYPAGAQANIRSVAVTLPKQLPSRLTTIQQACPEAAFAANPASCPAGSNIGIATARTPVLANAVTGPAYLVSHGGAAFPDLVLILQGEGIKLELIGSINIKKSITSSTFATVPDAPISSFELSLPEGPHSGLAAVLPAKAKGSLCGTSLVMPTTMTGQNGATFKQNTKITVTGCPKAKKVKKHTRRAHGKKKAKAKKARLGARA
jgi:hypothetical protein